MAGRSRRSPRLSYRDRMAHTYLGRSGVSVSRFCLGTMNFGAITGESDARLIMDRASGGAMSL